MHIEASIAQKRLRIRAIRCVTQLLPPVVAACAVTYAWWLYLVLYPVGVLDQSIDSTWFVEHRGVCSPWHSVPNAVDLSMAQRECVVEQLFHRCYFTLVRHGDVVEVDRSRFRSEIRSVPVLVASAAAIMILVGGAIVWSRIVRRLMP